MNLLKNQIRKKKTSCANQLKLDYGQRTHKYNMWMHEKYIFQFGLLNEKKETIMKLILLSSLANARADDLS